MYILIIARGYPTSKYLLNGVFEFDQAKALQKAGCNIVYASIDLKSIRRIRRWGIKDFEKEGVTVAEISWPVGGAGEAIFDYVGKRAVTKLYKHVVKRYGRPALVHVHFLEYAFLTADLCEREKLPFVITEHYSKMNHDSIDNRTRLRAKYAYSRADAVIGVSEVFCDRIARNVQICPVCIHNVVDTDIFLPQKRNPYKKDGHIFVSTGNLKRVKGFDLLIKAFSKIIEEYEQCKLIIIGDGVEKQNLMNLVRELDLSEQVCFKGALNRTDIARVYHEADTFVLASRSETFGVVYIEAMASGLPVIATRCGGPENFVIPQTGKLIEAENIDDLYRAMQDFVLHKESYDTEFISNYARCEFSPENISGKIIALYENILHVSLK